MPVERWPRAARHQGKFFLNNKYPYITICYICNQKVLLAWEYHR